MRMRTYNHISDCWDALHEANSVNEVVELFDEFPRKFGDWSWRESDDGYVVVENTYFDRDTDSYETDEDYLDIIVGSDGEDY